MYDCTISDVYRKHVIYCSRKQSSADPISRRPQPPRQYYGPREALPACASCSLAEALCDRRYPCTRCVARNLKCRPYEEVNQQHGHTEDATENPDETAEIAQLLFSVALRDMPYLSRVMDTTKHNMLDYFRESDNDGATNEGISDLRHETRQRQPSDEASDEADLAWDYLGNYLPSNYEWMFNADIPVDSEFNRNVSATNAAEMGQVPALTDGGFAILRSERSYMFEDLHQLHCRLLSVDPSYQINFDMIKAQSDLSAENLQFFMAGFLRFGHPHMPIVHYPTCGDLDTSWVLVLALVMGGAVRADTTETTLAVLQYFRLVEEYTFDEMEKAVMSSNRKQPPTKTDLQTLQAGTIIISHMISTGDTTARCRARALRLPKLVNAVRHFGLAATQYKPGADWSDFIYHEMCVR